jgi:hypothetical protein
MTHHLYGLTTSILLVMKRYLQIYYGFIIVFSLALVDMTYNGGQLFLKFCPNPKMDEFADHTDPVTYEIQRNEGGGFKFMIMNNSPIPKILFGHRLYSSLKLTKKDLFILASRKEMIFNEVMIKDSYSFDCGTGLELMILNPYQKFEQVISYKDLLERVGYIKNKELLSSYLKDSIKIRFFLPAHSIVNGLQTNSYSNSISISTKDLKKHLNIDIKEMLTEEISINPEIPAVFPGGKNNFLEYFYKNLKLPAINSEIKSNGVYQFIIDENGNARDVKVMRSLGKPYDDEVISVLNSMPKWTPGEMKGRPIKQKITLPLRLHLE